MWCLVSAVVIDHVYSAWFLNMASTRENLSSVIKDHLHTLLSYFIEATITEKKDSGKE